MSATRITKGQLLYREKPLRRHRHDSPIVREVQEVTVDAVGSKYFTITEDPGTRYLKATLRDEHYHLPALRWTAQELTDEWESATLKRDLSKVFDYQAVPLPVLRQVAALVAEQLKASRQPLPAH